jgi:hypothetical protein
MNSNSLQPVAGRKYIIINYNELYTRNAIWLSCKPLRVRAPMCWQWYGHSRHLTAATNAYIDIARDGSMLIEIILHKQYGM